MSTVIVKENETLDSAIRRWKKKCAKKRRPTDVVFFIRDSPCERV